MKKGQKHSKESIEKMSRIHKAIPSWNDGSDFAKQRIEQCRLNGKKYGGSFSRSIETRIKLSEAQLGEKAHNWQGGKTKEHDRIRHSYRYRLWKLQVKERDGYMCIKCSSTENLHVDHIKPFAWYPELRFEVSNGRVLCYKCHKKTKTWGPRYRPSTLQVSV